MQEKIQVTRRKAEFNNFDFDIDFKDIDLSQDNVVNATSEGSDQPAHTRSLIRALASRLNIL